MEKMIQSSNPEGVEPFRGSIAMHYLHLWFRWRLFIFKALGLN